MTDERVDPETLAAFLDGTLPPGEREQVLTVLARGGEPYEDFMDAAALLGVLAPELPELQATSAADARARRGALFGPQRSRRLRTFAPFLAAAGIAGIMVVSRGRDGSDAAHVVDVVRTIPGHAPAGPGSVSRALGEDWSRAGWPAVRGGERTAESRARAFRMGVRSAQLELALAMGDGAAVVPSAAAAARLAAGVEGGGPVAARIEGLARSGTAASESERRRTWTELRELAGAPEWFDAGAWTEAARLAALGGRADFFAPGGAAPEELDRLLAAVEILPASERQAAAPIVDPLRGLRQRRVASPADAGALLAILDSVIARGGR